MPSGANFWGFLVNLKFGSDEVTLFQVNDNPATPWELLQIAPVNLNVGSEYSYNLKVQTIGTDIKVYVDGVLKIDVTNPSYVFGYVGLRANQGAGSFSNIMVSNDGTNITLAPSTSCALRSINSLYHSAL